MTWCSFGDSGEWRPRHRRRCGVDHPHDRARSSEYDLIAVPKRHALPNPLAIHERPVLAAEVFDGNLRAVDVDPRVMPRRVRRAEELAANDRFSFRERDGAVADLEAWAE